MSELKDNQYYLMCERNWLFHILIFVGGFFGAYTYLLKGNVFCNAQTGNVVLMGMAFGSGEWKKAFYYLIPISAYVLGALVSELVPNTVKRCFAIRWDTLFIVVEMTAVIILGLIPESAPVQISQIIINFIASMQYNTFRQAEGVPMATTFATNHIRQIGVGLAKEIHHFKSKNKDHRLKLKRHSGMLVFFAAGAVIGTILCNLFGSSAIFATLLPLMFVFYKLLYADLKSEKNMVWKKPSGH